MYGDFVQASFKVLKVWQMLKFQHIRCLIETVMQTEEKQSHRHVSFMFLLVSKLARIRSKKYLESAWNVRKQPVDSWKWRTSGSVVSLLFHQKNEVVNKLRCRNAETSVTFSFRMKQSDSSWSFDISLRRKRYTQFVPPAVWGYSSLEHLCKYLRTQSTNWAHVRLYHYICNVSLSFFLQIDHKKLSNPDPGLQLSPSSKSVYAKLS